MTNHSEVTVSDGIFIRHLDYLVSVTAGGPVSHPGHMKPSSTVDFVICSVMRASKFSVLKLIEVPFWLQLVLALSGHHF